ncbi:Lrp/AsnC family transcriptional regulator [Sinomonas susongensis]|uniref:Lrp/AsnC family transcriptional regulator n=1 Tax=Sinomonas susongensis TaxID=1324851 RepID=UPI0011088235|nr:Lrp/AsnC ligand binding domain-containing protein [Sinomonas susongensis]
MPIQPVNHARKTESEALSEDDLELIHALQMAPRVTWQEAAVILQARPATLAARWRRIQSEGLAWITSYRAGDPNEMNLAFVDVDCAPGQVMGVAEALSSIPEVQTVELPAGHHDCMLTVFTETLSDYSKRVAPAILAIPGVVRIQTTLGSRLHQAGHSWRLAALDPKKAAAFAALATSGPVDAPLTQGCWDLLPLLAHDGRATAAQMAKELGRSASAVQRQLSRVLASGTVSLRCDVAQAAVGFPVTCTWYARVPPGEHQAAAAAVRSLRSVRLAASTTGQSNFLVTMWLRSVAEVMTAELALQERVPGIDLRESMVMLRMTKRMGMLIGPDTRALGRAELLWEARPGADGVV